MPSSIVIVGNGPLGLAIAGFFAKLQNGQIPPVLSKISVEKRDYTVIDPAGGWNVQTTPTIKAFEPQMVFVAVKAYALSDAIKMHAHQFAKGSVIIPLCNGRIDDVLDSCRLKYSRFVWRRGLTTVAAYFANRKTVRSVNASPQMMWGAIDDLPQTDLEKKLCEHPELKYERDIMPAIIRKWIANAVINTLTAAYSLPRNGLISDMDFDLQPLVEEAVELAHELWPKVPKFAVTEMQESIVGLIEKTAMNENSMAQDRRLYRINESPYLAGQAVGRHGYPLLKLFHAALT